MRHKSAIFTCARHLEAAEIAAQAASLFSDVYLVIDKSESGMTSAFPVIWSDWERFGNLNGYDACIGVSETLLGLSDSGLVMKIDSDTIVGSPSQFLSHDIAGFPQVLHPPNLLGCCYSISRRALQHAIGRIRKASDIGITKFAEDVVITGYAQTMTDAPCFSVNTIPIRRLGVWCPTLAPIINQSAPAANFGNVRPHGEWHHKEAVDAMRLHLNRLIDKSQSLHS